MIMICSFLGVCGNNLVCLELNCCKLVKGRILKIISKACLNLEELHLQSCTGASAASFAFLKSLTSLRVLDLYRTLVDTESLVQIMSSCQKLERVNLGACNNNNECSKVLLKMARKCK
ncbi:hypothetical protein HELRODRAFT_195161, partial [Helobdella robusta]|uniref:Uncharacterized protein n=1 Tax=Helobdella robusta TaxID=6412 RepID=T1FWU0_HELRO